ncbi:MAG: DUF2059 domain-containing protein [Ottowia sp.]|nr:DUF2059 domain-containing protein [Ottowia sp.]
MKLHITLLLSAASFAFALTPASAQESREALIRQLVAEQKIEAMFEQQIAQSREAIKGQGSQLLQSMTGGAKPDAKMAQALDRYMERATRLFTADEYLSVWAKQYGADLSDEDLRQLLAHYRSPIGRKEVAANQRAMAGFSAWANEEGLKRATALMTDFARELDAAAR